MNSHKVDVLGPPAPNGHQRRTTIIYRDLTEIRVDGKTVYLDAANLKEVTA